MPAQASIPRSLAGGRPKRVNHHRIIQALSTDLGDETDSATTYVGPGIQLPLLQTQPASGWAVAHFADASTGEKVMVC